MSVVLKRIYDEDQETGGYRVLVDGIWPRGIKKEDANLDEWMDGISPSKELHQWFNHDPEKFEEFKKLYTEQIEESKERKKLLDKLIEKADGNRVVLLFGAKDEEHNQAVVIKELMEKKG
ncbi:DUF488 domain-containing protein [Thalassobacillus hwangdonensis]|uniref:DUF488 domain-containing protein n=1 Tax=Thalassobacillus hwangdonensis TaxID=546108 RepID=A0ABW3L696_9BACI